MELRSDTDFDYMTFPTVNPELVYEVSQLYETPARQQLTQTCHLISIEFVCVYRSPPVQIIRLRRLSKTRWSSVKFLNSSV